MKIAITSTGGDIKSKMDRRFGRCAYFAIYDTEVNSTEFILNEYKESVEGAGPASAQFIANKGVSKVYSGDFGNKVKSIFNELTIEMKIIKEDRTVEEIINKI